MKVRSRVGVLALAAAATLAVASPAMAKGGTGGGGGGGGTTVPTASCAQIVSAIVNPNPIPFDPKVFPMSGPPAGYTVSLDVTVNNQCIDEGGGARSSAAVAMTTFDTATGAQLSTGVNMQPAGMLMTWRYWGAVPSADTTAPAYTNVISVTRANGQVQDTVTYTAAQMNQLILTAVATQTPQSLR